MKEKISSKILINVLVFFVAALSMICALIGIFSADTISLTSIKTVYGETIELYQKGIYARDSVSMASQAIGQDIVTLILGIPLLITATVIYTKKNIKGLFLLAGTAAYFLYTYTSYSFLCYFNKLFLVYVLLMIFSFYLFVLCMIELNKFDFKILLTERFPRKSLMIFLFAVGVMLLFMWLGRIIPAYMTSNAPVGLEHYSTLGIQTLDLGFVVPTCFIGGILLKKGFNMGYLLSIVILIKGLTMTAAVSAMTIMMQYNGVKVTLVEKVMFPISFCICVVIIVKTITTIKQK